MAEGVAGRPVSRGRLVAHVLILGAPFRGVPSQLSDLGLVTGRLPVLSLAGSLPGAVLCPCPLGGHVFPTSVPFLVTQDVPVKFSWGLLRVIRWSPPLGAGQLVAESGMVGYGLREGRGLIEAGALYYLQCDLCV